MNISLQTDRAGYTHLGITHFFAKHTDCLELPICRLFFFDFYKLIGIIIQQITCLIILILHSICDCNGHIFKVFNTVKIYFIFLLIINTLIFLCRICQNCDCSLCKACHTGKDLIRPFCGKRNLHTIQLICILECILIDLLDCFRNGNSFQIVTIFTNTFRQFFDFIGQKINIAQIRSLKCRFTNGLQILRKTEAHIFQSCILLIVRNIFQGTQRCYCAADILRSLGKCIIPDCFKRRWKSNLAQTLAGHKRIVSNFCELIVKILINLLGAVIIEAL